MPTRVLLIRHADVENPRRVLYGHLPGFGLSARGREQATELGRRLKKDEIRQIAHSPLLRARETAQLIAAQLWPRPPLEEAPQLAEAEFSRHLQGLPYWQIPLLRPLWFVHKARRGWLDGDEPVYQMGERILGIARDLAARFPEQVTALISHADPLQAAWVVLDGRAGTDRELTRRVVQKAGLLDVEFEGERPVKWTYVTAPKLPKPEPEPAATS
jgi:broad specificity phosphatase PhoE